MAEVDKIRHRESRAIRIEAEDRESLLVEWLNEIIYLIETENLIFGRFEIDKATDTMLSAKVFGESPDDSRHGLKTQVKAVTYHDLKVGRDDSLWFAQVIFDV
jgi:SHS2 domain-containing protein